MISDMVYVRRDSARLAQWTNSHHDFGRRIKRCCQPVPTINASLLTKVLDHIDAHPEQHNQSSWVTITDEALRQIGLWRTTCGHVYDKSGDALDHLQMTRYAEQVTCGTAYCLAGWAVEMTRPQGSSYVWNKGGSAAHLLLDTGEQVPIVERARIELGLTCPEADWMFAGVRNRKDLRRVATALMTADHERLTACT